jgi:lipopolysaccharide export system ATP-binding protein
MFWSRRLGSIWSRARPFPVAARSATYGYRPAAGHTAATGRAASSSATKQHRHAAHNSGPAQMISPLPPRIQALLDEHAQGDRTVALALHALLVVAAPDGAARVTEVAVAFRDDYLGALKADGRDAEHEAGRLGLDEVRHYLVDSVLPRLAGTSIVELPAEGLSSPDARVTIPGSLWAELEPHRVRVAAELKRTGEHPVVTSEVPAAATLPVGTGSVLEARGLVKMYQRRPVVNDVALRLQQGEIVGLLGPNGAGKTTTFYMIVGLIQPMAGEISLDGKNITKMPMYKRAQLGVGYLSQEPSIFRKLSVEDNILAILETLPISSSERKARLELLLDELNIKHLRKSKAYALSGGERRRLEITRALVTQPKFMMLDEPFAGVDPIAVHDIQGIVAGLRHRGIGVLISDHNVEQTLDIVDRAYIMFDGQVKVSGTVRDLVFDDTVANIYLGPTLSERLRSRYTDADRASGGGSQ